MDGGCSSTRKRKSDERQYKGIRMRKWGKWVAEIREPNKRSRIWLGSYSTAVAAARAYDTAVYLLRGPSARLNFPDLLASDMGPDELSAASIRKKAAEVGARVDAFETSGAHDHAKTFELKSKLEPEMGLGLGLELKPKPKLCWLEEKPDLNKKPKPEPGFEYTDGDL